MDGEAEGVKGGRPRDRLLVLGVEERGAWPWVGFLREEQAPWRRDRWVSWRREGWIPRRRREGQVP